MCGRAAQTAFVVEIAASKFSTSATASSCSPSVDNYNLSPGMDCDVILMNQDGNLQVDKKKWGIISKNGTANKPLYTNEKEIIKLCFESMCFNARSETLYSKPTFAKLAHRGRTCIIALDGYFEWKSHPIPKMNKTKQPYFVYRKQQLGCETREQERKRDPLLIAGIWTTVDTGIPNAPELGSFAMLTTEASGQINWLHHRMPVCIWDIDLAKQWLTQPSEYLKEKLDSAARSNLDGFGWHKVTPDIGKLTFRSKKAIMEIKESTRSIRHFFAAGRPIAKKAEKKDANHIRESNDDKVKEVACPKSSMTAAADTLKKLTPTSTTRNGKREQNLLSAYFSPSREQIYKKCKLDWDVPK